MLLLYYYKEENAGKSRSCAEHFYGQGHFRTRPLRSRDFVTSGQKSSLGLHMRRKYFRTGHVTDVTSGHLTNVTSGHVTNVTSGHVTSGHVTSGSTTAQLHRKYGPSCAHILLPRYTWNIVENGVKHYKSNQSNYIKCTRVRTEYACLIKGVVKQVNNNLIICKISY